MSAPRILIAAGCPHATTTLYRCVHLGEQLEMAGFEPTLEEWYGDEPVGPDVFLPFDGVVLQRIPISRGLEKAIERAQNRNIPIFFDTDDLIFEPAFVDLHRAVAQLPSGEQRLYRDGVRRYAATLDAADGVIVSTPTLAELVERKDKPVIVHRNGPGREMLRLGEALTAARKPRQSGEPVIIGYGSGTPTHDVDFAEASAALARTLIQFPQTELWIVGPLTLPSELESLAHSIRRLEGGGWRFWLETLSRFDINLAPLERGNLFCRAKSEIKVTEASLVGRPSVASQTAPYADVIEDGVDGFLVKGRDDWRQALAQLIEDPQKRAQMGAAARERLLTCNTLEDRSKAIADFIRPFLSTHKTISTEPSRRARINNPQQPVKRERSSRSRSRPLEEVEVPLTVNWVITEPIPGGGGFRSILRMIDHLRLLGHRCPIYLQPQKDLFGASAQQLDDFFRRHFDVENLEVHLWEGSVNEADATFATYWPTAYDVAGLNGAGGKGFYLVQDFEPFFYQGGRDYALAQESYQLGLHAVCLGEWLTETVRGYGARADRMDFAVDLDIYRPDPGGVNGEEARVCFYARPSTPRRGYALGMEALSIFHRSHPEVEILLFGANDLPAPPPFPHRNLGILNRHELARLYASCTAGMVLSFTNPSLIPLEMMACGTPVVEIRSERLAGLIEHEQTGLLALPFAKNLATELGRLIEDDRLRSRLVSAGLQRGLERSWLDSSRQLEQILKDEIPGRERVLHPDRSDAGVGTLFWRIEQVLEDIEERNGAKPIRSDSVEIDQSAIELAALEEQVNDHARDSLLTKLAGYIGLIGDHFLGNGWGRLGGALVRSTAVRGRIEQTFVADRSGLRRIELLPARVSVFSGRLHLALYRGSGNGDLVGEQLHRPGSLKEDQFFCFDFPTLHDSFEQTYTLVLTTVDEAGAFPIALWRFMGRPYAQGELSLEGEIVPGYLVMRPRYGDDLSYPREESLFWQPPVERLPNRVQKVGRGFQEIGRLFRLTREKLRSDGPLEWGREVVGYLRWRIGK